MDTNQSNKIKKPSSNIFSLFGIHGAINIIVIFSTILIGLIIYLKRFIVKWIRRGNSNPNLLAYSGSPYGFSQLIDNDFTEICQLNLNPRFINYKIVETKLSHTNASQKSIQDYTARSKIYNALKNLEQSMGKSLGDIHNNIDHFISPLSDHTDQKPKIHKTISEIIYYETIARYPIYPISEDHCSSILNKVDEVKNILFISKNHLMSEYNDMKQ